MTRAFLMTTRALRPVTCSASPEEGPSTSQNLPSSTAGCTTSNSDCRAQFRYACQQRPTAHTSSLFLVFVWAITLSTLVGAAKYQPLHSTSRSSRHSSNVDGIQHVTGDMLNGQQSNDRTLSGAFAEAGMTHLLDADDRLRGLPHDNHSGKQARDIDASLRALHSIPSYNITLRYTACGGLFNQQYSHIAALTLAIALKARAVIWPPMQERASFNNRFSMRASLNEQTWIYLPADAIWDMATTSRLIKEQFGVEVVRHEESCKLPKMVYPRAAFQRCRFPVHEYDGLVRFTDHIYLKRFKPEELAMRVRDTIDLQYTGREPPKNVMVDLPCTLFMLDFRNSSEVEGLSKAIKWNPKMVALADKVVQGIKQHTHVQAFNGVHLRMEKDAADWARIVGGTTKYWLRYKIAMRKAGFASPPIAPLYVASGLLKASTENGESKETMDRLAADIIHRQFATRIVHKELYLTPEDLDISNEQSALVDYLVLLAANKVVGVGVSTFSFYLHEARLSLGLPQAATELVMMPKIGSDELFFTCALVAVETRARLQSEGLLHDNCRRPDLLKCFSNYPLMRAPTPPPPSRLQGA